MLSLIVMIKKQQIIALANDIVHIRRHFLTWIIGYSAIEKLLCKLT
jgi:hypothetical protein